MLHPSSLWTLLYVYYVVIKFYVSCGPEILKRLHTDYREAKRRRKDDFGVKMSIVSVFTHANVGEEGFNSSLCDS